MATVRHTKPTTTLAAYLDLEDQQTQSCPTCRCSTNSAISLRPKPALSRTARAIVFGTILIKRVRERKIHRQPKSDGRKRSLSLDSVRVPVKENRELVKKELDGINQENREISLSSGSIQSFSISISEPKISNKKTGCGIEAIGVKQREVEWSRRSCYAFNSSVRLLMVSLGVTVMQGRVLGILITSISVYFFAWMQMEDCWLKKKATKCMEKRENRH
ncbi:uncharacterized protein LOC101210838 [Cucumis sativus]|uniref:Uncharacterized protein n=1 Tax=Cucumis sativus TaxID=3659 RepID=A0A0A0KE38_CUCSA|nr:uncharacterized protein LOC101210838 [Cucumis sativus]KGN46677.1 hypothetical protein Csa_020705 [Cucumis sativus]